MGLKNWKDFNKNPGSHKFIFRSTQEPLLSLQRLWRLHGSSVLSVASRCVNRLWQEMAPTAVGSCIQVYGGSWGATGISFFVIKGDRRRSFSPQGGQHKQGRTSRSHSYFLLLPHICGSSPWEFSLAVSPSPYLLFPNTAMSPSLFLGESVVPSRFVPPLRWHPFSEGDLIVLLLTNLCYPMCQRILKIVNDCMRIYNEKICTMVENV